MEDKIIQRQKFKALRRQSVGRNICTLKPPRMKTGVGCVGNSGHKLTAKITKERGGTGGRL